MKYEAGKLTTRPDGTPHLVAFDKVELVFAATVPGQLFASIKRHGAGRRRSRAAMALPSPTVPCSGARAASQLTS
jgi:hypothetical protein